MLETETIDETIGQIERLYQTLTGREAPAPADRPYAAIPPERTPEEHVQEQLDRLVASLGDFAGRPSSLARWTPPISVWEGPKEIVLSVDLPGVPREAIQLRTIHGMLEITGERPGTPFQGPPEPARLVYIEHGKGAFRRVVPVPPGVSSDDIQAHFREGVLEIRMPKGSTPARGRTIDLS